MSLRLQIPHQWLSKLSKEQQAVELNSEVRCKLAASPIHGVGVFAIRDIKWGERCYCRPNFIPKFYNIPFGSLSKLFPEIKELVLQRWASVVNGSIFCSPNDDAHLLMFINHTANREKLNYDVVSDTALRDIKKGEELFEDYRVMDNWTKVRPVEKNLWLNDDKENGIIKENKPWYGKFFLL